MALFNVIKYNCSSEVFAWKYPSEQIPLGSQLIVGESQEAVFVKSGKLYDVFESGRYTLNTENIPLLQRVVNLPFGGRSPFAAEIWFINKIFSMDIKWGTASPVQLQDPKYGILVPVRSFGQFGIRVADSVKFLSKLVGNMVLCDKTSLNQFFRGLYLTKVKDHISTYLVHNQISVVEINAYLDEISKYMKDSLGPVLMEYGIELVQFNVNDINVPEEDPAVVRLKAALAKKAEMDIIGYSYQQEKSFDTLKNIGGNSGSGVDLMGLGINLGMGTAIGSKLSGVTKYIELEKESVKTCPKCNKAAEEKQRFCGSCGYDFHTVPLKKEMENPQGTSCPSCGVHLIRKSKFCPECGYQFGVCPKCKAGVTGSAKFCPECGEKLS